MSLAAILRGHLELYILREFDNVKWKENNSKMLTNKTENLKLNLRVCESLWITLWICEELYCSTDSTSTLAWEVGLTDWLALPTAPPSWPLIVVSHRVCGSKNNGKYYRRCISRVAPSCCLSSLCSKSFVLQGSSCNICHLCSASGIWHFGAVAIASDPLVQHHHHHYHHHHMSRTPTTQILANISHNLTITNKVTI